jgi:predicted Zn-dependent protease
MTEDEALGQTLMAVQDDPLNAWVVAMHSNVLGFVGRHEESIAEAERAVGLDPESFLAQWNLMRAYAWAGQNDRAIEKAPALLRDSGRHQWVLGTLAWTCAKAGQSDRARAIYEEMTGRSHHEYMSPFWLASAAASAGSMAQSIRCVERAVNERDPLVFWGRLVPFWDVTRVQPEFRSAMGEVWAMLYSPRDHSPQPLRRLDP